MQNADQEVSTVQNENLTVNITKKPHCQVIFDIIVNPRPVVAAYQKALKNINKEVNIPGFRKGKAPDKLILEKYSSAIQQEFVDIVLNTAFHEAIQLTNLHPLKDGETKRPKVHECSIEKGAHFTLDFETRPIIPAVKVDELQLKKITPPEVTKKEQDNALQNLIIQFAKYEPINDRPAEENDFADLDMFILEDPPRQVVHNQRTYLASTGLPEWLRRKVIGLKAGESAEGMTEQDLSLVEPDPHFKSLPFRVIVNAIWNGNLPAIDENLAKKVGLQSIEELENKIRERLEQENQENAYQAEIQQLEDALVEKYPIDLPQSYINANKKTRLDNYLHQLTEQGKEYTKEEEKQIENMIEQNTIYHLRLYFLFHKIAAEHQLAVTKEDLSQELTRQITLMSSGRNNIDLKGDRDKFQDQLQNLAMDRKIKQFLLSNATVIN